MAVSAGYASANVQTSLATVRMIGPLAQIVGLLSPDLSFAKYVEASGAWRVARQEDGRAFFVAPLEGAVRLRVEGGEPLLAGEEDFALFPAVRCDVAWSADHDAPSGRDLLSVEITPGIFLLGQPDAPLGVCMLVVQCASLISTRDAVHERCSTGIMRWLD